MASALVVCVGLLSSLPSARSAAATSSTTEDAKIAASDAAAMDEFAFVFAASGDAVVSAARWDDHAGGTDAGSGYVFRYAAGNWSEEAKLIASDAAAEDQFGVSISMWIDTVVVGANLDDDGGLNSGAAYVFAKSASGWGQDAKLTAFDAAAGDNFGRSVAVSYDTIAVGADQDDDAGADSGAVYVFVRSGANWVLQAKLLAADASAGSRFGFSASLSGDLLVVGAIDDSQAGTSAGAAYVFERSGGSWSQQAKLVAADAGAHEWFGYSVSISGTTVVAGALFDDAPYDNSGSAYVFETAGAVWNQQAKLVASDAAAGDNLGVAVAVAGNTVVVGAPANDDAGNSSGSAYVFRRTAGSWVEDRKLTASDAAANDRFGDSVALSGSTVFVGARLDDGAFVDSGSAYVYRFPVPWTDLGSGLAGSYGIPVLAGEGTLIPGSSVSVDLTNAKESALAGLVAGTSTLNTPFKGGTLVPNDDLMFALFVTSPQGGISHETTLTAVPPVGTPIFFQYWIQDPLGPMGFSASNALTQTTE